MEGPSARDALFTPKNPVFFSQRRRSSWVLVLFPADWSAQAAVFPEGFLALLGPGFSSESSPRATSFQTMLVLSAVLSLKSHRALSGLD